MMKRILFASWKLTQLFLQRSDESMVPKWIHRIGSPGANLCERARHCRLHIARTGRGMREP